MTDVLPGVQSPSIESLVPTRIPEDLDPLADGVLMVHQRAWIEDPAPMKLCEKGRRVGITWAEALDAVFIAAASRAAGGDDVYYLGDTADKGLEFIRTAAHFARHVARAALAIDEFLFEDRAMDGDSRYIRAYRITFASGYRIVGLSGRPENIRGLQGVVIIDEAAFHRDVMAVVDAVNALQIWEGRVRVISSHNGEDNPFHQLVRDSQRGIFPFSVHRITFQDAVNNGLYERVCLVRGRRPTLGGKQRWYERVISSYGNRHAARDEELFCIPRASSGAYFTRAMIEQCQQPGIPIVRLSRPEEYYLDEGRLSETREWCESVLRPILDGLAPTRRCVLGQDFGRDGNLSGIWILQDEGGGRWTTPLIIELRRLPFDCQSLILFWLINHLPLFWCGALDARGNGQSHAEAAQQRYGLTRIVCVKATPEWYATHFPPYRAAYEDRSIVVPEGEDIIADHRLVELVRGRPTMADRQVKGSDGEARHGDLAIAGLLAWSATREGVVPAEFASSGRPRDSLDPFADAAPWQGVAAGRVSWTGY